MRITKKFTGSQCLGKRVYHQCDVLQASHAQVLAALEELAVLERRFKLRLEREKQKNRHEMDSETTVLHAGNVVSTPAIDAMVLESRGIKAWHSAPCHPDLPFEQLPYHAFQLCGPKIFHQRSSYKINHYSHQTPSAMINYHSINNLFSSPKEEISDQMDQSHLSNHSHQDYLPIAPVHSDFTHSMDTATSSANESNSCPETQTPNDDDASGLLMGFFNHMRRFDVFHANEQSIDSIELNLWNLHSFLSFGHAVIIKSYSICESVVYLLQFMMPIISLNRFLPPPLPLFAIHCFSS
mmetsp:Transcript_12228/g.16040  ORF Transcript_12228/g.16040 Transcript_12228/m.16040 type:complete len:296 (-) Transcript_12228:632-1519(-)